MKNGYTVLDQAEPLEGEIRNCFADDVAGGLRGAHKSLPSKYIYDDEGSRLFCRIMELPEYYLTSCETGILRNNAGSIADATGNGGLNLVELGAGDGKKTRIILNSMVERHDDVMYVPIDISESAVKCLLDELGREYTSLRVKGLVTDYFAGLRWLSGSNSSRNVVLFLGSNIGNFTPEERMEFLTSLHASMSPGDYLLIGFDMVKNVDVLENAYNDSQGITARFNKNLLHRINRELGADFNTSLFRYDSRWYPGDGAIKSYLVSERTQEVLIKELGQTCSFEAGEAIHTESSYKFTRDQLRSLARESGFSQVDVFYDSRYYFADCLWMA